MHLGGDVTVYASMQPGNFSSCLKYLGKCACKYVCLYGCYMYKFVWVGVRVTVLFTLYVYVFLENKCILQDR